MTDELRPAHLLDTWLAKYGTGKSPGAKARLYGYTTRHGVAPSWRLLSVERHGETALTKGIHSIVREILEDNENDRTDTVELISLAMVNTGEAALAPGDKETPRDMTGASEAELADLIQKARNLNDPSLPEVTVSRLRAGMVPCESVNLISPKGLASLVSMYYPDEPVPFQHRNEQYADEETPEPTGMVDQLLMDCMSFVLVISDTVRRGYQPTPGGLLRAAKDGAKEHPDTGGFGLALVMRMIASGLASGLLDSDDLDGLL